MKSELSFTATVLFSLIGFAHAAPAKPTTRAPAKPTTIEIGSRIGPIEDDIEKKMLRYIRANGTLSGQVGEGQGWTAHIVAIRCQIPQGELGKGDKPHCEYVEVKTPETPAEL